MFDIDDLLSRYRLDRCRFRELTSFSETRVDQILAGDPPSLSELRKMATALGIPISYLASWTEKTVQTNILFRKSLGTNESISPQLLDDLTGRVSNSLDLLGDNERVFWVDAFDPKDREFLAAEQMAQQYRDKFFAGDHVSPMLTLPRIVVEDMNVLLFVLKLQDIEGAAAFIDGQPFIFLAKRFLPRMLFTLAHEIGHLLADRNQMSDFAHLDIEDVSKRRGHSSATERFANAFAAALLLPAEGVGRSLKTIHRVTKTDPKALSDLDIILLSRIYGTSFNVAARRCEDLKLLPYGGEKSLYETICKQHQSPEKRGDSAGLPARPPIEFPNLPLRLLNSAVGKVKSGDMSIGKVTAMLGMTIPDLMDANTSLSH